MTASFPGLRLRRLRKSNSIRGLVQQTLLSPQHMVYPLFVVPGQEIRREIPSMPGCSHLSSDMLIRECEDILNLGIPMVLIFGLPNQKDPLGQEAYSSNGVVQKSIQLLKRNLPELLVATDVCLCGYTDHGHCGIVKNGHIDNDATIEFIARTAVSHAEAGADLVAPSDMMDGRIAAVRLALDQVGFVELPIMAYSAKYASAFFEPFRHAASSEPKFDNRLTYQMDPANSREGLLEMQLDAMEGADILMVKPALPYLDILARARNRFDLPLAGYNVSGEYAMIKAAAAKGWLDERKVVLEILTSIKRAGADLVISYHAKDAVQWINEEAGVK